MEVEPCRGVCVTTVVGVEVNVGNRAVAVTEATSEAVGLAGIEVGGGVLGHPDAFVGKLAGSPPGGSTYTGDAKLRNPPRSLPAGTICGEAK